MTDQQPNLDAIQTLAPLARVIADTVQETPIRVGSPEGAVDLIQQIIIRVAAYMGSELPATPGLARHMVEVDAERQRQLAKWGEQQHPDGTGLHPERQKQLADEARALCQRAAREGFLTWSHILMEEVREAMAETDPAVLRTELVQCAAVIQAWLWDLDSRTGAAEESHVVADDSDDPEHVDDCPGCEAFTLTGHRAARPAPVAGESGSAS